MRAPDAMDPTTPLAGLGEEAILDRILPMLAPAPAPTGARGPRLPVPFPTRVGPGDDAAVVEVPVPLVVTTDSMIRGRDWRDDWSDPADVAHKLGAQNISDIAAMGAVAVSALLTITADPATPMSWVSRFATGLGEWCTEASVTIVGGDLSSAPAEVLQVSLTMWGDLQGRSPVLRSGARPGDVVAVCGSLGRSSAGLAAYEAGLAASGPRPTPSSAVAQWQQYHRRPRPPWEAGPSAADAGATAMIDLSDGLVRDAARVAAAGGVVIDLDRRGLDPFVSPLAAVHHPDEAWRHVLGGGEEHSLLAVFPGGRGAPSGDPGWRVIGSVRSGDPAVTLDGADLEALGWDHFASVPRNAG